MPRFVVLYHECPDDRPRPSHWDLMLEEDEALRTWALNQAPNEPTSDANELIADQLPDHRLAYLEYEGPVSGDRGHVTRWDNGEFRCQVDDPEKVVVELEGKRLRGVATLIRDNAQRWRFSWSPASR
jgi:hypothetical protein